MKKSVLFFSAVGYLSLAALCLTSCVNDEKSSETTEEIEGTWYCKRAGYNKNFEGGDSRIPCTCVITEDSIEFRSAHFPNGSLKEAYELEESSVSKVYNLQTGTDLFDVTVHSNGTLAIGSKTDNGFIIHGTYSKK